MAERNAIDVPSLFLHAHRTDSVMPRVKHIALLRFKPECTPDQIAEVWRLIEELPREIPGIIDLSHGPNVSTEGLDNGFTNSFVITFESVAARDAYLPHPVHQKAVDYVVPKLEKVIVIDHEVNEQAQ